MELKKYQQAIRAMTRRDSPLDTVIYDSSIPEASDEQLGARQGFEAGTIDPKKATMALDMLKRGMDVDTISAITDLTTEQINQLSQTAKPISTWSQEKRDNEILTDSYIRDENPNEIFTTPFNIPDSEDNVMPSFEGLEDPKVLEDYQQMELADGGVVEREDFAEGSKQYDYKNPQQKNQHLMRTTEEIQSIVNDPKYEKYTRKDFRNKNILTRKETERKEVTFKNIGARKSTTDPNEENIKRTKKIKNIQGANISVKGSGQTGKQFSHVYPLIESAKPGTKTTGTIDAKMNRALEGYNKIGQNIAEQQEILIKNKPEGYKQELVKLNARAKRNVMNAVSDLGKEYKGQIGYFQVDPETGKFKEKAGNYKMSFAGIKGENKIYKDMMGKERKDFEKKISADNFKEPEQKLLKKMGTQLNSGIPINEIMNVLPEREAQVLRNMGSKIGKIAKIGARGLADLTTGLGPLGVAITALIETPVALAALGEGKRGSEVAQDAISSITFGLVSDSEERVLKEIGGERAVKGLKIKKSIEAYQNAVQDLKNLNTELKDPASTLLSEDQDAILAGIERNQKIKQDQGTFLQQFINLETKKFIAPDLDYYEDVAKTQQKERDLTKQIRSNEGSGDYFDVPDLKEQETRKELDALKQTYEGNKVKPVEDIMNRNIMNPVYGGRMELSAGSTYSGLTWVARRVQDINQLIKSKKAGFEDFFDEIQLLRKAEELNLTEEQVKQILKQQQQQRIDNYRKLPVQGDPKAGSRLPYDPNANPKNSQKIKPRKEKNFNTQNLDNKSNIEDIINNYATGGRVGLKLGSGKKLYDLGKKIITNKKPENPDRRDFLKGAGAMGIGLAALGTGAFKIAKTLKTKAALNVLAKPAVGQPAWFAPLVDKILLKGIRLEKDGKKLNKYVLEEDGKTITLEIPFSSPNNHIDINVKGGGAYDDPFDIYYQRTDKGLGGDKKPKSSFKVLESRPYRFGSDADEVELSEEIFQGADLLELPKGGSGILSDMEGLEKIATGKIKNPKLANTRVKIRDELNQPDNYRSRYNPGEEDRLTRSTGPEGGEYYENLDGEDYYSVQIKRNDLDPDIDYD